MHDGFLTSDCRTDPVFLHHAHKDAGGAVLSRKFRAYYRLRPLLPVRFRQYLQRCRTLEVEDDWFIPAGFVRSLARSVAGEPAGIPIIHPWPDGARFCFVLTHDVETSEGMRNVLRVARIEEELGFRSSWNIVPHKYDVDPGLLADLRARSFEIGIHGYNHDGRLYASKRIFDRRAAAINEALTQFGAVGFRSPMVHRNLEWLQALHIEYDASCFDIDPFQAMPGGVGSVWPFVAGRFVELPYTLPQDHTLFITLRQDDCRIWQRKLDFIVGNHGMALMLTHPDYLTSRKHLELYRQFLLAVRDRGTFWHALPKQLAAWWRKRDRSRLQRDSEHQWRIDGPACQRGSPATVECHNGRLVIERTGNARPVQQRSRI